MLLAHLGISAGAGSGASAGSAAGAAAGSAVAQTAPSQQPPLAVAPGLLACGDYVEGPYPATLEGAVRSGLLAVEAMEALR